MLSERNQQLLDEVIEKRLENTLQYSADGDPSYEEAMKGVDRKIKLLEIEEHRAKRVEELELKKKEIENQIVKTNIESERLAFDMIKLEIEKKTRRNEFIVSTIVKVVEVGIIVMVAPYIERNIKLDFAKVITEFERTDSFITMPGKSLSGLFKFRK